MYNVVGGDCSCLAFWGVRLLLVLSTGSASLYTAGGLSCRRPLSLGGGLLDRRDYILGDVKNENYDDIWIR